MPPVRAEKFSVELMPLNCVWLKALKASARSCRRTRSFATNSFWSDMSKLINPGWRSQFRPDSAPMLPGDGAKKQAALRRLKGSLECVYGSHP